MSDETVLVDYIHSKIMGALKYPHMRADGKWYYCIEGDNSITLNAPDDLFSTLQYIAKEMRLDPFMVLIPDNKTSWKLIWEKL